MPMCLKCGKNYITTISALACCKSDRKAVVGVSTADIRLDPSIGIKHDNEKPDIALISFTALDEVAKVMSYGKKKYAAHNWRNGLANTRLVSSTLRHISAYMQGEDNDPETGISHIAHAICGLMMLLENIKLRPKLDDRWKHE